MDLVALLPWWAGVGLAAISYWLLHGVATRPPPAMQTGRQISEALPAMMRQGFATGAQYFIPFICLMGALASFLRRRKRRALFDHASQATSADALQGMSWQEFEMLVGEGFKRRGYGVRETGGGGPDGGVDLVLTKAGEKFFVQCKQWKAFKVGVTTVRELYGVMAAEGATGGFVVTSGRFTHEAGAFAAGRNIQLMGGDALMSLLSEGRANRAARPRSATSTRDVSEPAQPRAAVEPEPPSLSPEIAPEPNCPRCAKAMVRRVAKKGPAAGKGFWVVRIIRLDVAGRGKLINDYPMKKPKDLKMSVPNFRNNPAPSRSPKTASQRCVSTLGDDPARSVTWGTIFFLTLPVQ